MGTIITYDVDDKHGKVKEKMLDLNYKDEIYNSSLRKWVYLPNTTLYHTSKEPDEAIEEIKSICEELEVQLTKCIAIERENWSAI